MTFWNALLRVHDVLSGLTFRAALCALATIIGAYCIEVVSRYGFNSPTIWVSPVASYALCALIFLALPELTRRFAHVTVDLQSEFMPARTRIPLARAAHLLSAVACFFAAWISGVEVLSEYKMGVLTNAFFAIPKWWIFGLIPYGFLSAGLHFLRSALGPVPIADDASKGAVS